MQDDVLLCSLEFPTIALLRAVGHTATYNNPIAYAP